MNDPALRADARPAAGEKTPGRRQRHAAETRERLFRTALQLFAERGFNATTVEDITEAADVGKGTFFNYFPGKEHILTAFGEIQLGKLEAALADAQGKKLSTRDVLHHLTHKLAEEPGRSPALVRSMLLANLSSEPVCQGLQRNLERGRALLAELMALGQQCGEIRGDCEPLELARTFQQTFFGGLLMWSLNPALPLAARLDTTFDLLWSGLAARPEHSRQRALRASARKEKHP